MVAVIGPPASGKTTLTRDLAGRLGYPVFRIADLLECASHHDPSIAALAAATKDPLGWVSDATVSACLDICFRQRHAVGRAVSRQQGAVLDNFPGRASQARLIAGLARGSWSVLYRHAICSVVLEAEDEIAWLRAGVRTACTVCGCSTSGEECPDCGAPAAPRSDDEPTMFKQRLARYRSEQTGVIEALRQLGPQLCCKMPLEQPVDHLADYLRRSITEADADG